MGIYKGSRVRWRLSTNLFQQFQMFLKALTRKVGAFLLRRLYFWLMQQIRMKKVVE